MAKKPNAPKVVTPKGVAVYPKLVEPDEYQGEKNYKTGLLLDPAEPGVSEFIDRVEADAQAAYDDWVEEANAAIGEATGAKKAKLKKALDEVEKHSPLAPEYDDEGEETGRFILNAKMKAEGVRKDGKPWSRTCPIFDSKGKDVTKTLGSLWGGSIVKLQVTLNPFAMPATNRAGVSGRLEAVQVVELRQGGADGSAFGVEEGGYCAEEDEQTSRFDDDIEDDVDADEDF